jgi:hypothetical protein
LFPCPPPTRPAADGWSLRHHVTIDIDPIHSLKLMNKACYLHAHPRLTAPSRLPSIHKPVKKNSASVPETSVQRIFVKLVRHICSERKILQEKSNKRSRTEPIVLRKMTFSRSRTFAPLLCCCFLHRTFFMKILCMIWKAEIRCCRHCLLGSCQHLEIREMRTEEEEDDGMICQGQLAREVERE